jgi:hypothetical protein
VAATEPEPDLDDVDAADTPDEPLTREPVAPAALEVPPKGLPLALQERRPRDSHSARMRW